MTPTTSIAIGDAPAMDLSRLDDVFQPSAFAEPASVDHAAMYADAVVRLLASGGVEQVSMGAVARWMGQVPSAVKQRAGGRDGFLRMVTARFARRWLRWVMLPARVPSELVRLPKSDDEVHGIRVWSTLCEVAAGAARAGNTELADIVSYVRREHRRHVADELRQVLRRSPTDIEVVLVEWLGEALRAAVTAAVDPLDPAVARAVVALVADCLTEPD
jgi:hypothetical protein